VPEIFYKKLTGLIKVPTRISIIKEYATYTTSTSTLVYTKYTKAVYTIVRLKTRISAIEIKYYLLVYTRYSTKLGSLY
jgi:hypothetical protein